MYYAIFRYLEVVVFVRHSMGEVHSFKIYRCPYTISGYISRYHLPQMRSRYFVDINASFDKKYIFTHKGGLNSTWATFTQHSYPNCNRFPISAISSIPFADRAGLPILPRRYQSVDTTTGNGLHQVLFSPEDGLPKLPKMPPAPHSDFSAVPERRPYQYALHSSRSRVISFAVPTSRASSDNNRHRFEYRMASSSHPSDEFPASLSTGNSSRCHIAMPDCKEWSVFCCRASSTVCTSSFLTFLTFRLRCFFGTTICVRRA